MSRQKTLVAGWGTPGPALRVGVTPILGAVLALGGGLAGLAPAGAQAPGDVGTAPQAAPLAPAAALAAVALAPDAPVPLGPAASPAGAAPPALAHPAPTPPAPTPDPWSDALTRALAEDAVLGAFYTARGHAPLWLGAANDARRQALAQALAEAPAHGLPRLRPPGLEGATDAAAEVALTRAFLAHARNLTSGALEPASLGHGLKREVTRPDPAALLRALAEAADPAAMLAGLMPAHPEYARLLRARAALSDLVARGGLGAAVREGPLLRPGERSDRLPEVRARLRALGYRATLASEVGTEAAETYDTALEVHLRAFQRDHGLADDGVIGARTLRALNLTALDRLAFVDAALERERWLNIDRGARHILVNLADFTVQVIDDGAVSFETRAVVGATQRDKQTPEFSDRMRYLEVNPDWTVPPGIIRRDYLPQLQQDPLALGHLQLIDREGRPVARESVDFAAFTARSFPFLLRQPPGDANALGRIKFMFPNRYAIYLHDTPEKQLFPRDQRTYSSGCVRLAEPFELAHLLLARQNDDPAGTLQTALDSGRQVRIGLRDPVPVHLDYRTAFYGQHARLQFRADVYGRDRVIHAALLATGLAQAGAQR